MRRYIVALPGKTCGPPASGFLRRHHEKTGSSGRAKLALTSEMIGTARVLTHQRISEWIIPSASMVVLRNGQTASTKDRTASALAMEAQSSASSNTLVKSSGSLPNLSVTSLNSKIPTKLRSSWSPLLAALPARRVPDLPRQPLNEERAALAVDLVADQIVIVCPVPVVRNDSESSAYSP